MGRRVRWLVLLLLVPLAAAQADHRVLYDRFVDVPVDAIQWSGGCGPGGDDVAGGRITVDSSTDSFTFDEGQYDADDGLPSIGPGGEARATCATAWVDLPVPAASHHVHVRFWADRTVDQAVTLGAHMPQTLRLESGGVVLHEVDVFTWDDGSHHTTRFAELGIDGLAYFPLPPGLDILRVAWHFEDLGQARDQSDQSVASGQRFTATVTDPVVEFSSHPLPIAAAVSATRVGMQETLHRTITVDPPELGPHDRLNIRVRAPDDASFSHIVTPSGRTIDATGSLIPAAEYHASLQFVLLEPNSREGYVQATLPASLWQDDGDGAVQFVFTSTGTLQPVPAMLALNAALAMVPLAFAALATQRIREFQREAFGAYRRTATNLMVTLGMVIVFYAVAMLGSIAAGWFAASALWPPGKETGFLLAQMLAAGVAFFWLWLTGREMTRIVRP